MLGQQTEESFAFATETPAAILCSSSSASLRSVMSSVTPMTRLGRPSPVQTVSPWFRIQTTLPSDLTNRNSLLYGPTLGVFEQIRR